MESGDGEYISVDDTVLEPMDCSEFGPLPPLSEELKLLLPDSGLPYFYNAGDDESSCSNALVSSDFDCTLNRSMIFPFDPMVSVEDLEFLGGGMDFIMNQNHTQNNIGLLDYHDVFRTKNASSIDTHDTSNQKDVVFMNIQTVACDEYLKVKANLNPNVVIHKTHVLDGKADNCSNLSSGEEKFAEIATIPVDVIHNKRPFKCMHLGCDRTFRNPQTLKMHHKTHYRQTNDCLTPRTSRSGHNKKIPCRCPVCGQTFVGLYELRRHFGRKHSEGEKMHDCKKCGRKFYIEVDLRDHEKICGEKIGCKCGLKFAFKCTLSDHKRTHPDCVEDTNNPASTKGVSAGKRSKSSSRGLMGMMLEDIWNMGCRSRSSTVIRDASRK